MRDKIKKKLNELRENSLFRVMPEISEGAGKYISVEINKGFGKTEVRKYINMASNNYLGLSEIQEIKRASADAVLELGTTSGASRIVTGNYNLYDELERVTAEFKQTEASLVFNSGYAANVAVFSALADRNTAVFSDKLNHASIIDGILLSGAKHIRYRHNDIDDLAALLEKHKDEKDKIIATDTIFSMDGDVCRLRAIVELAEAYGAMTIVDEAHASGIFGRGRGYAHEAGLEKRVDIHMGTFSKAFGSFGAYVAADRDIIDYLRNKGRSFIYSTSLPPAVVAANLAALKYVEDHHDIGYRLLDAADDIRRQLQVMGFDTGDSVTQIIPVILGTNERVLMAKEFLMEKGIYVGAIRPPTVPVNTARLRMTVRLDVLDETERILDAFRALKAAGI
ncbi:aminotransferase class I/II-fold pyridoxal phosphate-dependent enzyme [Seleniivibrio woodruffii]|uniref:aminotransferase class I/II-fold pyridoxal phosphate-dependent enzyme n=1 Tax=Seleniivibrio woodruffii TaxID=1078050 RepID=UPI0039E3A38C